MIDLLSHPLVAGAPVTYWQVGATTEVRYDLPDLPMKGEMDPFFFLTKDKNFIPHEYPCRTQFAADMRLMNEAAKESVGGVGYLDARSKRPAVPHGLRSTFRDRVAEKTQYPGDTRPASARQGCARAKARI
jgi:hypothetical protein